MALFLTGCGSAASTSEEHAAKATSADTNSLGEMCGAGMVDWSQLAPGAPQTCAAGVQYVAFKHPCPTSVQDSRCPPNMVWVSTTTVNSCTYSDYLLGPQAKTESLPYTTETDCQMVAKHIVCTKTKVYSETCQQLMAADQTWEQNSNPAFHGGAGNTTNFGGSVYDSGLVNNNNGTCSWTLYNAPHMTSGPNVQWCGETTSSSQQQQGWQTCTVDIPGSCGPLPPTYLPAGDSLHEVSDNSHLQSATCLSTEDVPIPASDAPNGVTDTKFGTLQKNLASSSTFTGTDSTGKAVDDTAIANALVQEMKLLFELHGDKMTPADQTTAASLYTKYPTTTETPSCGTNFVPPSIPSCAADPTLIQRLNAEMEFCARMTSPHVNPAIGQLPAVYNVCLEGVAADIGALRSYLLANGGDDGSANAILGPSDAGAGTDAGDAGDAEAGSVATGAADAGTTDPNDLCGFKAYRAQFDTLVTTPLEGRMEVAEDATTPAGSAELLARLQLIDRWYKAIAANLWPVNAGEPYASSVQSAAWAHAQSMERVFYQNVYRNLYAATAVAVADAGPLQLGPDASVPDGAAATMTLDANALAALTQDTLKADRALLGILFPYDPSAKAQATPPLQSAPLMLLLGDTFEAMAQRMHDVGVYHDMGCAYIGCGPAIQSELVWLMELLASVPDATPAGTQANTADLWKLDLWEVLSLAHAARDASNVNIVGPEWLAVYDGISAQHAALENATQSVMAGTKGWASYAAGGVPLLTESTAGTIPAPLGHFAGVMLSARVAARTYLTTGLFNPTARNRLPAGIAQANVDAIRKVVSDESGALSSAASNFDANLVTMANAVVQEMNSSMQMTNSLDQIRQKGLVFDQTADNLDGLGQSLALNQLQLSTFIGNYSALTATDDNGPIAGPSYGSWRFDVGSARASGPLPPNGDVSKIAAQQITDGKLTAGTIVNVQVSPGDRWSPTCALQAKGALPSVASPTPAQIDFSQGALAGPEGFTATIGATGATLSSNQTSLSATNTASIGVEAKSCIGARAQAGVGVPTQPTEAYVYVDTSACLSMGDTQSITASGGLTTSNSTNQSASVNFTTGLRLPNTPFPNAPVGSLLAVITPHGNSSSWTDIRVIQSPTTAIVLEADSDIYFVSNDTACSGDASHQLTVSVSTAQHAGTALGWVPDGLAALQSYFDGLSGGGAGGASPGIPSGALVAQGGLTPDQAAEIRSTAMTKLTGACNTIQGGVGDGGAPANNPMCDPSKFPASVAEFVNNYIDRQVEAIELRVQILQAGRTLSGLGLELQQMVDDYDGAQSQAAVAGLIPQWLLRNLDTTLLQKQTAQLVNVVTYDLYPVIELRYPDLIAQGLANDQVLLEELQQLVAAKWDAPVDTLAKAAGAAGTELTTLTANLTPYNPAVKNKPVALDFVRPGYAAPTNPPPQQFYPTAAGSANLVWTQATTGNHIATFHIDPESLYSYNGGTANLLCDEEAPVILDFAVYLSGLNVPLRLVNLFSGPVSVNSYTSSRLVFPMAATYDTNQQVFSAGGPMEFDLSNPAWASLDTPIYANSDVSAALYGTQVAGQNSFSARKDTTVYANGQGLSPFTDITIDFSALYDTTKFPLADNPLGYFDSAGTFHPVADHITLVFNLQYRAVAESQTMNWISSCKVPAQ